MNQILSTNNSQSKKSGPISIKKIVMFFCITIIIFGAILTTEGIYGMYYENQTSNYSVPKIQIAQEENLAKLQISNEDLGISKIIYKWNNQEEYILQGNNNKIIEKDINVPEGNNTLDILLIDELGNQYEYTNSFIYEKDVDRKKPTIEFAIEENKNVKIVARDETEIAYITYRWNEEEEKRVNVDEDRNKIEQTVEILRGTNKLTVIAVDKNNNTITETKTFKGVNEPTIELYKYDKYLIIIATHDIGIEKIEYEFNGKWYRVIAKEEQTRFEHAVELVEGENKILINAYSKEDTMATKEGKTTYQQ